MTCDRIEAERQRIREGASDYYAKRESALREHDQNVETMRSQLRDAEQKGGTAGIGHLQSPLGFR